MIKIILLYNVYLVNVRIWYGVLAYYVNFFLPFFFEENVILSYFFFVENIIIANKTRTRYLHFEKKK